MRVKNDVEADDSEPLGTSLAVICFESDNAEFRKENGETGMAISQIKSE